MEENMSISTELLTSINDAMYVSTSNAESHMKSGRGADAMCLLNEWTSEDGECILTQYVKGEICEKMGSFMYINMEEETWGEFIISDDG